MSALVDLPMVQGPWDCIKTRVLESLRQENGEINECNGSIEVKSEESQSRKEALQLCVQRPRVESAGECADPCS